MSTMEETIDSTSTKDSKLGSTSTLDSTAILLSINANPNTPTKQSKQRNRRKIITDLIKFLLYLAFVGYFIAATIHYIKYADDSLPFKETMCTGYGFLVLLFIFVDFLMLWNFILKPYLIPVFKKLIYKPIVKQLHRIPYGSFVFFGVAFGAIFGYLIYDSEDDRTRLIPISGLGIYLLIGYGLSAHRSKVPWKTVCWGLLLQYIFGLLTIRWEVGRMVFDCFGDKVNTFLGYAVQGSAFVYGDRIVNQDKVFAFQALATIYFLGFVINILYYYGIMQKIVTSIGQFLQYIMDTSICESVNSAANIFLGMSEAPLLLKPYLVHLTDSEIHSVMTSGFATVSGSVLAAYISFGANPAHLITASVMSAPAALCFSKLMYPETEEIMTTADNMQDVEIAYDSVLDAASQGANDATQIVLGIIASIIGFIAFVYFLNGLLSWFGMLVGYEELSVELIMGKIFIPITFVMGVPWEECELVGQLIGIKTMVNEFAAFERMQKMVLSEKSKMIATYSICGFSNPGSIGIMISALGSLIPAKREVVIRLVFRAVAGGAIVCFMTACIAATLVQTSDT